MPRHDAERTNGRTFLEYGFLTISICTMAVVLFMLAGSLVGGLYDRVGGTILELSRR